MEWIPECPKAFGRIPEVSGNIWEASRSVRACPETFGKRLGVSGNACKGSRNVWEASRKLVKSSRKLLKPSESFGSVRQLQNLTGVAFGSRKESTSATSVSGLGCTISWSYPPIRGSQIQGTLLRALRSPGRSHVRARACVVLRSTSAHHAWFRV